MRKKIAYLVFSASENKHKIVEAEVMNTKINHTIGMLKGHRLANHIQMYAKKFKPYKVKKKILIQN